MAKVRAGAAAKWNRRTASATQEYIEGVKAPRASWQSQTSGAVQNYNAGVQQAISQNRFAKGVAKVSDQQYQETTVRKGQTRFAEGVQGAEQTYAQAVQPYIDVINSVTLPPRGPNGDPKNYQRVIAMGNALRARKLAMVG
jgi:hypothetical protein